MKINMNTLYQNDNSAKTNFKKLKIKYHDWPVDNLEKFVKNEEIKNLVKFVDSIGADIHAEFIRDKAPLLLDINANSRQPDTISMGAYFRNLKIDNAIYAYRGGRLGFSVDPYKLDVYNSKEDIEDTLRTVDSIKHSPAYWEEKQRIEKLNEEQKLKEIKSYVNEFNESITPKQDEAVTDITKPPKSKKQKLLDFFKF